MSTIYIKFHGTSSVQYFFPSALRWILAPPKSSCPLKQKRNISLMHLCVVQVELSLADTSTCVIWKDGRRTCDENIVVHTTTMGCRCLISKLVRRNLDTINLERGSTPNQICSLLGRVKIELLNNLNIRLGVSHCSNCLNRVKEQWQLSTCRTCCSTNLCKRRFTNSKVASSTYHYYTQRHAGGKTGRTN